jgi:hypothetical protein
MRWTGRSRPPSASAPKHPPNTQLTWQRLQRGWSREELVEQIKRSMKQTDEAESGLNSDIVRRWETGDRKPEPRYKKHVVLVFGKPASELGLLSAEELALCPAQSAPATTNALMNKQLVDAVVKKVMLVVLGGNAEFGRHLFLKGVLGASLAPLLSNGVALPDSIEVLANEQRTRLDPRSIDAYTAITTSHRDLYWTSSASELLSSVTAHIRLGDGMLKSVSDAEGLLPRRLAAAVAESALLASRLIFFDLARAAAAEEFFQLADDAAEASQDHALAAAVLAHRAFVPGFAEQEQPARDFLKAAHAHRGPTLVRGGIRARGGDAATGGHGPRPHRGRGLHVGRGRAVPPDPHPPLGRRRHRDGPQPGEVTHGVL